MASATPRVLRVAPATVAIFSVMLSPSVAMALLLLSRGTQLWDAALLSVLYVATLYGMCARTVELAPGQLVCKTGPLRKRIDLSRLVAARIVARPALTLELRFEGAAAYRRAFTVKPFTKAGVSAILHHLRQCRPDVEYSGIAENMVHGDFDRVSREAIKAMNLLRMALLVAGVVGMGAIVRLLAR